MGDLVRQTYREFTENMEKTMGGSAHLLVAASGGGSGGNGVFPTPENHAGPISGEGTATGEAGTVVPGSSSSSRSNR